MLPQVITIFSSPIGKLIYDVNKKEKVYEKYVKLSQKILIVIMAILFPIYIPLFAVMWLNTNGKIKIVESVARGGIFISNSIILMSLMLLYQLIEGRRYKMKKLITYELICFVTFLGFEIFLKSL